MTRKDRAEDLIFLIELVEAGEIKSVIDRRYSLEQIAEAHRYIEKGERGHHDGRVIMEVIIIHNYSEEVLELILF
jgi:NADPH:quinone reductase-like Zn-dependent oxidoreductase